jgi:hypothetical protein
MRKEIYETKKGIGLRLMSLPVVFLTVMSLMACPIIIPPAVHYYETRDAYVASVTLKVDAEKVYSEVVSLAEQRQKEGKIKITNEAKQILFLEATDGAQTAGIKVNKAGKGLSHLVITSDIPKDEGMSKKLQKDREQELAVRIVRDVCQALNQNCTLVEQ